MCLRSGVDGSLVYDAPGSTKWTATYTGLTANDVLHAVGGTSPTGTVFVGAESRAHWLGRDPLALTEATIFENGPGVIGGPSAPLHRSGRDPGRCGVVRSGKPHAGQHQVPSGTCGDRPRPRR